MASQRRFVADVNAVGVWVLGSHGGVEVRVAVFEQGELESGAVYAIAGAKPWLRRCLTKAAFEATPPVVAAAPGVRSSGEKKYSTVKLG